MTTIQAVCMVLFVALALGFPAYAVTRVRRSERSARLHLEASARTLQINPTGLPSIAVVMMIRDAVLGCQPTSEFVAGSVAIALGLPPAAVSVASTPRRGEVLVTVRFPWWRLRRAKWLEVARGVAERYSPAWTVVLVEAAK